MQDNDPAQAKTFSLLFLAAQRNREAHKICYIGGASRPLQLELSIV
jgi:hypothetical protein